MAKLGLDHATLEKKFPRLIYVSHKGFLPGPYENRLALDEVVQNMAGLTYMTGPKGRPLRAGTSVNDIMGGMFGAIGVLAALRERERTGRGQEIQSALFENCCLLAAQHMQQFQMTGEPAPPMPSRVSAWSVYDVFTMANDEQLFIGAVSDKQFQTLVPRDRPDGPRRGRGARHQRAARRAASRAAQVARRHAEAPFDDRADAAPRGGRHSVRADRPPGSAGRRPAPDRERRAWSTCRPTTAARPRSCCCRC
jgi:crotonobetainyl-CoA:carnitine CoA-transferase CaiB-like acyl-CoA transferase